VCRRVCSALCLVRLKVLPERAIFETSQNVCFCDAEAETEMLTEGDGIRMRMSVVYATCKHLPVLLAQTK